MRGDAVTPNPRRGTPRPTLPMFLVRGEEWRTVDTTSPDVLAVQRRSTLSPTRWITVAEVPR